MKSDPPGRNVLMVTCPACGKRQRVTRRGAGKLVCGHCREQMELPPPPEAGGKLTSERASLEERVQSMEKMAGRLEALEAEVARLRSMEFTARVSLKNPPEKRAPATFAGRLENCRAGRLQIHFAQHQARASEHATQISRLFVERGWQVDGPSPSALGRGGTTFAVGALPMAPALADLFMALGASGVEVVSILDQNLALDEACLTITNDTAWLAPGKKPDGDSVQAA